MVRTLLARGFTKIRCLTRAASGSANLDRIRAEFGASSLEVVNGNLLSRDTCARVADGVAVVYHLAAGVEKTFPGCFLNSAVTTRNLLDAVMAAGTVRRFVNISSLAVYSNAQLRRGGVLSTRRVPLTPNWSNATTPTRMAKPSRTRSFANTAALRDLPYVIVRPGITFGPGKTKIPGTGRNRHLRCVPAPWPGQRMPLTYVENCAEAIVLAGLTPGIEGEELNIVDDDLPRSREFLRRYKRNVTANQDDSRAVLALLSLQLCLGEIFGVVRRTTAAGVQPRTCEAYYKSQTFSNQKAKTLLGWRPRVGMSEALDRFCAYARERVVKA